jgi:hypothetical protein
MWPRSRKFDAAVTQSHTVVIRADLWTPGRRQLLAADLDLDGGQVTASRTGSTRRTCRTTLIDRDGTLGRLFSSRQTVPPVELELSRGIEYPDGSTELLPLGIFGLADLDPEWRVVYPVAGYDRSRRVRRNTFTSAYVVAANTSYVAAAVALVRDRIRFAIDVRVETSNADTTPFPLVYLESDDPWAKAQALASAAGCEIFFDQRGALVVRDVPDTLGLSVDFAYLDGETSVLLPDTTQKISDDPGYNGVLAMGESSNNDAEVPRHLAIDDDPASITYYHGDYGPVTETYTDPTITTTAQAQLVARSRLRHWLGRNDSMALATVPHPAHDPGDVVRVRWHGRDQLMGLDSVTIPLDVTSAASLSVRSQISLAAA